MAKYTGINHLAMVTHDMRRTIRFWRDLLGMRLIAGLGRKGYRHYFFEISEHDMVAFFEWPHAEPIPEKDHGVPVKGPVAFDHVSIAVASDDDLWELKDRLEAAGFWVSEAVDHGFIHSIYSFDPNNIPIEFSAPVAEVDLRRHPQLRDKDPPAEAREGADARKKYWPQLERPTPQGERTVYPGEGMVFRDESNPSSK
jgi:catechol 2,3-dioxygenase-like lactoylglutathione lyase family enzyme